MKPYDWAVGTNHFNLACRGMAFFPSDYAAWILRREVDGPINVFETSAGLLPMLTSRDPPSEAALDWLKFAYTADRAGDYVEPASSPRQRTVVYPVVYRG